MNKSCSKNCSPGDVVYWVSMSGKLWPYDVLSNSYGNLIIILGSGPWLVPRGSYGSIIKIIKRPK